MAVMMIRDGSNDSLANYDEAIRLFEVAGQGHPAGRLYHFAARKGEGYIFVDIWESEEAVTNFGQKISPVLEPLNSPAALSQSWYPVYNIIKGAE